MATPRFSKPRLPSHYYIWHEPPDDAGDEVLHFVSERRRLKLKGHSFREFVEKLVPLLDGRRSLEEIERELTDYFNPQDIAECLKVLEENNLIEDGDNGLTEEATRRLAPQLNLFHETGGPTAEMQRRLGKATVAIIGLGGAGAMAALSLAAAGVGTLRCVDALPVSESDIYLSGVFQPQDVGIARGVTIRRLLESSAPQATLQVYDTPLEEECDLRKVVDGSTFVVCCLDIGQSNLIFKLNRVCMASRIPWTSCTLSGVEVILGPTVYPFEGPCYMCYRMRAVACAGNPEDAFALERYLDRHKQDDTGRRENLVFGAGIAAHLVGIEALKELSGLAEPSAKGKIIVFDLLTCTLSKHTVLRKPWCPACFSVEEGNA